MNTNWFSGIKLWDMIPVLGSHLKKILSPVIVFIVIHVQCIIFFRWLSDTGHIVHSGNIPTLNHDKIFPPSGNMIGPFHLPFPVQTPTLKWWPGRLENFQNWETLFRFLDSESLKVDNANKDMVTLLKNDLPSSQVPQLTWQSVGSTIPLKQANATHLPLWKY